MFYPIPNLLRDPVADINSMIFTLTLVVRGMQNCIWNSAFVLPRAKEVLIVRKARIENSKNVPKDLDWVVQFTMAETPFKNKT